MLSTMRKIMLIKKVLFLTSSIAKVVGGPRKGMHFYKKGIPKRMMTKPI
jgi:hypothetical protein